MHTLPPSPPPFLFHMLFPRYEIWIA
jgi:hypothetical protein